MNTLDLSVPVDAGAQVVDLSKEKAGDYEIRMRTERWAMREALCNDIKAIDLAKYTTLEDLKTILQKILSVLTQIM